MNGKKKQLEVKLYCTNVKQGNKNPVEASRLEFHITNLVTLEKAFGC